MFKGYFKNISENYSVVKELWKLIVKNKKWALVPFFVFLCLFGLLIAIVGGGAILPAIYAIF